MNTGPKPFWATNEREYTRIKNGTTEAIKINREFFGRRKMMNTSMESAQRTGLRDLGVNGQIAVVRVELKQGTFTQRHRHESECMVMVLEGALRFHLPNRVVTLSANEMLRL